MRLINSTDFTAEIEFADADVCAEYADESCEWGFSRDKIKEIIGKIPSIDAEPVIRCRDCAVPHNQQTGCPKLNGLVTTPDFFCAYGETSNPCKTCRIEHPNCDVCNMRKDGDR